MALVKQTNHSAAGVANLVNQLRGKKKVEGLVAAYSAQIQQMEDVLFQLLLNRTLTNATGKQLDGIGAIVGEPRTTTNDTFYRMRILARVRLNTGSGEVESLIDLVKVLLETTQQAVPKIVVTESSTASVQIRADGPVFNEAEIDALLERSSAGGVNTQFFSDTSATAFILNGNTTIVQTDTTNGMGTVVGTGGPGTEWDGVASVTGGDFSTVAQS